MILFVLMLCVMILTQKFDKTILAFCILFVYCFKGTYFVSTGTHVEISKVEFSRMPTAHLPRDVWVHNEQV